MMVQLDTSVEICSVFPAGRITMLLLTRMFSSEARPLRQVQDWLLFLRVNHSREDTTLAIGYMAYMPTNADTPMVTM